jgi:hypothetical protein
MCSQSKEKGTENHKPPLPPMLFLKGTRLIPERPKGRKEKALGSDGPRSFLSRPITRTTPADPSIGSETARAGRTRARCCVSRSGACADPAGARRSTLRDRPCGREAGAASTTRRCAAPRGPCDAVRQAGARPVRGRRYCPSRAGTWARSVMQKGPAAQARKLRANARAIPREGRVRKRRSG